MITLASSMTFLACRTASRALTASQEARLIAAFVVVGLVGALATILHAIIVAISW